MNFVAISWRNLLDISRDYFVGFLTNHLGTGNHCYIVRHTAESSKYAKQAQNGWNTTTKINHCDPTITCIIPEMHLID